MISLTVQTEILEVLQEELEEAGRQKEYLDQLYTLMLERAPDLLEDLEVDFDARSVKLPPGLGPLLRIPRSHSSAISNQNDDHPDLKELSRMSHGVCKFVIGCGGCEHVGTRL